jgi:GTP-binding protein
MVLGRLCSRRVVGLQCMASLESRYSSSASRCSSSINNIGFLLGTRNNAESPFSHHPTFASSLSSSRSYFSSSFHHEKRFHLGQAGTKRLLSSSAAAEQDESSSSSSSTMNNDDGAEEACRYTLHRRQGVRNVAIIAHVDHGKTTLVDQLLRAAARRTSNSNNNNTTNAADGSSAQQQQQQNHDNTTDRLMDSGELEKERGITITSKITRVEYVYNKNETMILNIVDTPGHADFCGEVDRILDMVDGVCLVVDAAEGPMTQTKYVLSRALAMHLKPIVVLNKCDRVAALAQLDNGTTENSLKRLFEMLQQNQKTTTTTASASSADRGDDDDNYVTMYASARQGWVTEEDPFLAMELAEQGDDFDTEEYGMHKLLDVIVREIPEPSVRIYTTHAADDDDTDNTTTSNAGLSRPANFFASAHPQQPLSMAAVTVGYDPYLGRTCTGRIVSGSVQVGDAVTVLSRLASNSTGRNNNSDASSASTSASSSSLSSTISGIFVYKGIHRIPFPDTGNGTVIASAGDCVTLAGVPHDMAVGDTLTSLKNPVHEPLSTPPLAPPTLAMDWSANQGPLAGQDGTQIASSKIQQRLQQETDNNVTLSIEPQQEKTVGT